MPDNTLNVPTHVGFILDGNRRWAKEHGLPTLEGHRTGYENLKTIATAAFERGIEFVSAYCFSTENWNRSKEEVSYLLKLASTILTRDAKKMIKENIRILVFGVSDRMPRKLLDETQNLVESSKGNTGGTLVICFNYGGRREIADAVRRIVDANIPSKGITEDTIAKHIYSPEVPNLDLLIRTGGEQRISNFMLWRAAYTELYFTNKYWPDFETVQLDVALDDYRNRNRRFGGN